MEGLRQTGETRPPEAQVCGLSPWGGARGPRAVPAGSCQARLPALSLWATVDRHDLFQLAQREHRGA